MHRVAFARAHPRLHGRIARALILVLALASCKGGGPTSPDVSSIALSEIRLILSGPETESEVSITNLTAEPLEWRVLSSTASWLSGAPSAGTLAPGGTGTMLVRVDRRAVPTGTHTASLQIGADGRPVVLDVTVQEYSAPRAVLEPTLVTIGPSESSGSLQILNSGGSAMNWTLRGPAWVSIAPASGSLAAGAQASVVVTPQRAGLTPGEYVGSLELTFNGGTASSGLSVAVAPISELSFDPANLDFGGSATRLPLRVTNTSDRTLDWIANPERDWIGVSSSGGRLPPRMSQLLYVDVSRAGLSHGTNQAPIQFTAGGASSIVPVKVQVIPAGQPGPAPGDPELDVSPLSLDFGSTESQLSFTIQNRGGVGLDWTGSTNQSWAILSTNGGQIAAGATQRVDVRVTRSGSFTPGTHRGAVQVSSKGGSGTVLVSMDVTDSSEPTTPSPEIRVDPKTVDFGTGGVEQTLRVLNTGSAELNWSRLSSPSWASLATTGGRIAPGGFQDVILRVSRSGLSSGVHQGLLQLTSNGGNANVSLLVEASASPPPAPPELQISPTTLDFGLALSELTLLARNTGGSPLQWSASTSVGWATILTPGGTVPAGGSQTVTVRVFRSGLLSGGTYQGTLQLSSNGGNATVALSLRVPASPPIGSGATVNVQDYGAQGDGVADDAPAFKQAIEAVSANGGTVVIPAGHYRLTAVNLGPFRPIDLSKKNNITIAGDGMDNTVLEMASGTYGGAANMFLVFKSSNITIKDLTIDMNRSASTYLDEQSHCIRVVSSSNVRLERIRFQNSPGDGVYLLGVGEPGEPWTERIWIENSRFSTLARNGVSIQRGVQDLEIRGNTFEKLADQAVSAEPSGSGGVSPRRLTIEDNLIKHSSTAWAVAMGGARRDDVISDVAFANNRIENGAAYFTRVVGLRVAANTIVGDQWHSPVRVEYATDGLVEGNNLTGVKANNVEGILQVINEEEALSSSVIVRGNTLNVNSGSTGIYVRDARADIIITGNTITGTNGKSGILVETLLSFGITRRGFEITGNVVRDFRYGIMISKRGDPYTQVSIKNNELSHSQQPPAATIGILFSLTGSYANFAEVASNSFGSGILSTVVVQ